MFIGEIRKGIERGDIALDDRIPYESMKEFKRGFWDESVPNLALTYEFAGEETLREQLEEEFLLFFITVKNFRNQLGQTLQ